MKRRILLRPTLLAVLALVELSIAVWMTVSRIAH
jgi:hypothetical protein